MRQIFKDIHLHQQMEEQGYVVMPMLNPNDIEALNTFYQTIATHDRNGIYSNVSHNNYNENVQAGDKIAKIFKPYVDEIFMDCYIAGGTFMIKKPDANSVCNMHQDWNNVEEDKHNSYSIWCPLIDCDEQNGTLSVIKGSHKLFPSIRCATLPSFNITFTEKLAPYLETVPLKAGEAIIFTHNLVHGSCINTSKQARLVTMCGVFPNEAPQIHYYYYKNAQGTKMIDTYAISNDFYYQNITKWLSGKRLEGFDIINTQAYKYQPINEERFFEILALNAPRPHIPNSTNIIEKPSITNRIANFFAKYF